MPQRGQTIIPEDVRRSVLALYKPGKGKERFGPVLIARKLQLKPSLVEHILTQEGIYKINNRLLALTPSLRDLTAEEASSEATRQLGTTVTPHMISRARVQDRNEVTKESIKQNHHATTAARQAIKAQWATGRFMVASDFHIRFHDEAVLDQCLAHKGTFDGCIVAGDLIDNMWAGRFRKEGYVSVESEWAVARDVLRRLVKRFGRVLYFMGNHEDRTWKQVIELSEGLQRMVGMEGSRALLKTAHEEMDALHTGGMERVTTFHNWWAEIGPPHLSLIIAHADAYSSLQGKTSANLLEHFQNRTVDYKLQPINLVFQTHTHRHSGPHLHRNAWLMEGPAMCGMLDYQAAARANKGQTNTGYSVIVVNERVVHQFAAMSKNPLPFGLGGGDNGPCLSAQAPIRTGQPLTPPSGSRAETGRTRTPSPWAGWGASRGAKPGLLASPLPPGHPSPRRPLKHDGRPKPNPPMTVCIAAIWHEGEGIVAASDRMLSYGNVVQYEPDQSKVFSIPHHRMVLMIAGQTTTQSAILNEFHRGMDFHKTPPWTIEEAANRYAASFALIRKRRVEQEVLIPRGLDGFQDWHEKRHLFTESQVKEVEAAIAGVHFEADAIVAGVDESGAHIYTIDGGVVSSADYDGFAVIGSGGWLSRSHLVEVGYSRSKHLFQALNIVYQAKRNAEKAGGVGETTDMGIIGKAGKTMVTWLDEKTMSALKVVSENYELKVEQAVLQAQVNMKEILDGMAKKTETPKLESGGDKPQGT